MVRKLINFLFVNNSVRQTVIKNTFWLFLGQILARFVKLGLIVYAARLLGASGWGAFSYALGIAGFFTVFIDFGVNAIITREASRDPEAQKRYFATALWMKVLLFSVTAVLVLTLIPQLIHEEAVAILIPLVVFIVGFDSLRDFAAAMSRAWEKMEIEAGMQLATNIFIVLAGFLALSLSPTPRALAAGYAVGTGLGMILAFIPCREYLRSLRASFTRSLIRPIIIASLPFALSGLMGTILLNTDTVLIGWFLDLEDVGYYSAAQRIVLFLYTIPGLLAIAFFPSMAKFAEDTERRRVLLEKITTLQFLTALPLTIGGILLAQPIIQLAYGGQYEPAQLSFLIMNLTYLPVFLITVFGNAVFALNHERRLFLSSLFGMIGNLIFDILFLPIWGIAGVAFATVINQSLVASYLWYFLKKQTGFSISQSRSNILLANIGMGLMILLLNLLQAHVIITVLVGGLIYLGFLLLLREETIFETIATLRLTHTQPEHSLK